jgi:hypothetical protein
LSTAASILVLGSVACGSDGGITPPDDDSSIDGTYQLQAVQGTAVPVSFQTAAGIVTFTGGSVTLGPGRTWEVTLNFTDDGQPEVERKSGVYDANGPTLTFQCGESGTFSGMVQSGTVQVAYDVNCDGQAILDLRFGGPPPQTKGGAGTYRLYAMGNCEIGADSCGPSTPLSRLPYSIGAAGGTTYHAAELTLRADKTWQLVIETTGPLGRVQSLEVGEYTTSGTDITFIRDQCRDVPHLGTVQGTDLRLVYNITCDVTYDLVMIFSR